MFSCYDEKINSIISRLTLHEKIGQLNQEKAPNTKEEYEFLKESAKKGEVGSILWASTAYAGAGNEKGINADLMDEVQKCAVELSPNGIPIIFGRDVIHGHKTVFPIPLAMSASFNSDLIEECYRATAKEAANDGVQWTFAPMIDLSRDPRWGRIIEGAGEDPYVGAQFAKAAVKGFQGENLKNPDSMVACAKHYIGYGAAEGGRDYHRTEISDYTLFNFYLPAFRSAVEAGIGTVMSSFNDISGQPISSSVHHIREILKEKVGFEGFVVSDWDAVIQLVKQGVARDEKDCAELSLKAGIDLDMKDRAYLTYLEELVNEGIVSEELIDDSVRRILRIKFAKGLFENPYRNEIKYDIKKHRELARKIATESMVLLKNDGVLPFGESQKIAVIGPFLHEKRDLLGSWTLDGKAEETPSLFEALNQTAYNKNLIFVNENEIEKTDFSGAQTVLLALGEVHTNTGEANSVARLALTDDQIKLIKSVKEKGKKTVGIIFSGRPLVLEGIADYLDGILYSWHSGSETATAACDLLFGKESPSGKLTMTFPRAAGHIPMYYNVTPSGRPVDGYYGENPQNCYNDIPASPFYPFGYGLSYTEFEYGPIKCNNTEISLDNLKSGKSFKLSVEVKNIGSLDAKNTVELYIRDVISKRMRPLRELKGFQKKLIKAGESEIYEFELSHKDLGYYDEHGNFDTEAGEFKVFIGEDCLTEKSLSIFVTK